MVGYILEDWFFFQILEKLTWGKFQVLWHRISSSVILLKLLIEQIFMTAYIQSSVWGAQATDVNKVYKLPVLRQLADKSNTNIKKATRWCQLVISTMQRDKIGWCGEECLNGYFRITGRNQTFEDHGDNILGGENSCSNILKGDMNLRLWGIEKRLMWSETGKEENGKKSSERLTRTRPQSKQLEFF